MTTFERIGDPFGDQVARNHLDIVLAMQLKDGIAGLAIDFIPEIVNENDPAKTGSGAAAEGKQADPTAKIADGHLAQIN